MFTERMCLWYACFTVLLALNNHACATYALKQFIFYKHNYLSSVLLFSIIKENHFYTDFMALHVWSLCTDVALSNHSFIHNLFALTTAVDPVVNPYAGHCVGVIKIHQPPCFEDITCMGAGFATPV